MKNLFVFAFAFVFSLSLFAFDSARWLAKRERMSADANRLRAAYSNAVNRISTPSEGITVPLETNPDGSVRTSVYAEKAQFFNDSSFVWAEDMRIVKLDADGKEKVRIEASSCLIDRLSKSGWIEGRAKVTQGKTVFEGDCVYFSSSNSFVTAYANSDLKSSDLKLGGLK